MVDCDGDTVAGAVVGDDAVADDRNSDSRLLSSFKHIDCGEYRLNRPLEGSGTVWGG